MKPSTDSDFLTDIAVENNGSLYPVIGVRRSRHRSYARRHAFALLPINGKSVNSDSRGRIIQWDSQGGEAAL